MINRIDNNWCWEHTTFLIDNEGRGLLYIVQRNDQPECITICGLQVMPEHQRKGIGNSLMNEAINIIKTEKDKVKEICLYANKNDEWIINWYKKYGFEIVDDKYEYETKEYEHYMIKYVNKKD